MFKGIVFFVVVFLQRHDPVRLFNRILYITIALDIFSANFWS